MDYFNAFNRNIIKIVELMKKEKKPVYFNEIAEKAEIKSKNNLLKNLKIMVQLDLIKKKVYRNNTYYIIKKENRINLILFSLIDEFYINSLPFEVKKVMEELRNKINSKYLVLFGSHAKGDYKKNSDIDVLIINAYKEQNLKKIAEECFVLYNKKIHFEVLKEIDYKSNFLKEIFSYAIPIKNQLNFYEENKDEIFRLLD